MAEETTGTWPEWAQSDDGEHVWVRVDLLDRAAEVAKPAMEMLDPGSVLLDTGIERMWLDVNDDYDGGWAIRSMRSAPNATASYEYGCFEVVMKDYLVDGERPQPNGTYAKSGGAS